MDAWSAVFMHHDFSEPTRAKLRPGSVVFVNTTVFEGSFDPVEFRVVDKLANSFIAARAIVWELEGYGWRWGFPSAGILDIQVRQDLRRQGLAKLLMSQVLRFLQDQFFGICECHAPATDAALVSLCRAASLEHVDTGTTYLKKA